MRIRDLICMRDGRISMTKLVACIAHAGMAAAFFKSQVLSAAEFNESLWLVYGGFAIGHASYDKLITGVKDHYDKKISQENTRPD